MTHKVSSTMSLVTTMMSPFKSRKHLISCMYVSKLHRILHRILSLGNILFARMHQILFGNLGSIDSSEYR